MAGPDVRLKVGLRSNPKWVRLGARLGPEGQLGLIYLWLWVREHRPKGVLYGITAEEVEALVGWKGDAGALLSACKSLGFVHEDEDSTIFLHAWEEHNPWAVNEEVRSEIARKNARKRWSKRRGSRKKQGPAGGMPSALQKGCEPQCETDATCNAPLPSPPLPSSPKEGGRGDGAAPPSSPQAARGSAPVTCEESACRDLAYRQPCDGGDRSPQISLCVTHYRDWARGYSAPDGAA